MKRNAYRACDAYLVDIGRTEAFQHYFTSHSGYFDIYDPCYEVGNI